MTLQAGMHEYLCPKAAYESTSLSPLVPALGKTGVSDIGFSVLSLATHRMSSGFSVSTAIIMSTARLVFLPVVWISTDNSCTISIGTNYELYKTTFHSVGVSLYKHISEGSSKKKWDR